MGLSRRTFVKGAGAGAVLAGGGLGGAALGGLLQAAPASAQAVFTTPLPIPRELTGADITLLAHAADVQVLPGPPTRMWTFAGTFPGPTIRRPSGARTTLTVVHALPDHVGDLHIHNHGNHSAPEHDGVFDFSAVAPGGFRTYVYELAVDGRDVGGRMQWYHDHSHHTTGRNVWMGLAGMFIVDDPEEEALGLPGREFELPLMIADRQLDRDNQLVQRFTAPERVDEGVNPSPGEGRPPFDEGAGIGNRILVNGAPEPYADVAARTYRLRILNASNFSPFNLVLGDGIPMLQVGTESGLLPEPVERESILLGPAERADVVVDFGGRFGQAIPLTSIAAAGDPLAPGLPVPRPATAAKAQPVMEFRVVRPHADPVPEVAPVLRPLPDWVAEAPQVPDRVLAFSLGVDEHLQPSWVINGRAYRHDRLVAQPELGSTETWALINLGPTAMSHYIHLHGADWAVVSRNGAPPAPWEAGLKETFRLDPGEVVLVSARFTDHLGRYVVHCHMLEHEDHGMMLPFEVVEPGAGDAARAADLREVLTRQVAGPEVLAQALAVVGAARGGRPAPASLLRAGAPAGGPADLWCDLPLS